MSISSLSPEQCPEHGQRSIRSMMHDIKTMRMDALCSEECPNGGVMDGDDPTFCAEFIQGLAYLELAYYAWDKALNARAFAVANRKTP